MTAATSEAPHITSERAPNGWAWPLLRGFRAGEAGALREVYQGHAEAIATALRRGFTFSAGGHTHRFVGYASAFELHDVLHETFVRAFAPAARARYDGIRPYAPYLQAIARNLVLRAFRSREVLFSVLPEDHPASVSDAPTPEQTVADQQVRELVRTFLAGLAPPDQELLRRRFTLGHSQRDVAEALGLGRQQVRTREDQLRRQLIRFLHQRGASAIVPTLAGLPLGAFWSLVAEAWR